MFWIVTGIDEEAADGLEMGMKCPVLFPKSGGSELSIPVLESVTGNFANDYEFVDIKSSTGHWMYSEAKDELNDVLAEFLGRM